MRLKIVLIAFLISLPVWWGFDMFSQYLGEAFYDIQLAKDPRLLAASVNSVILDKQLEELKQDNQLKRDLESLDVNAKAVISVKIDNQGNEKVMLARNIDEELPIASLSKLMTALVVFDSYDLYQAINISQKSVNQEESFGYLTAGESLSVNNLLHSALIESSNDAAYALSQPLGEDKFIELMNSYELNNTYFYNPTGLDDSEKINYSTANDLVKLTRYILEEHPEIFEITAKNSYKIVRPSGSLHHFISESTNKLLKEYPKITGGKTGWSLSANGCLLIILDDPNSGDYYINVVLGAGDRFGEMRKIINTILDNE